MLAWHRRKTRGKMDRVFNRSQDPYRYEQNPYEKARLAAMESALQGRGFDSALEVGCAEGIFTERLLRQAREIVAVDISPVALERAQRRLSGRGRVLWHEADIRQWEPEAGRRFDLIVLGDVLYYLDKPLVREAFEQVFPRVASWLRPGACLMLAHGFAGPVEREHREGFRRRFQSLGLSLTHESAVDAGGPVSCLISVLSAPPPQSQ